MSGRVGFRLRPYGPAARCRPGPQYGGSLVALRLKRVYSRSVGSFHPATASLRTTVALLLKESRELQLFRFEPGVDFAKLAVYADFVTALEGLRRASR